MLNVSLLRVWAQEIKHMMVVYLTHGLFLTCTQKIMCIYKSCIMIYTYTNKQQSSRKVTPCANKITLLNLLGEPASLLVVTNLHPPLSLVCQQLSHPFAFTPLTLSHPTVHITFLQRRHQQSRSSSSGTLPLVMTSFLTPEYSCPWTGWRCHPGQPSQDIAGFSSWCPVSHHGYFFLSPSRLGSSASSPSGSCPASSSSILPTLRATSSITLSIQ